ncbi:MAG: hypothetical protein ABI175_12050 [Polyangiales bacterium]
MSALDDFVVGVRSGTVVATTRNVRKLLDAGFTREAIFDALVAAASDPAASRRFHRALAILRDLER